MDEQNRQWIFGCLFILLGAVFLLRSVLLSAKTARIVSLVSGLVLLISGCAELYFASTFQERNAKARAQRELYDQMSRDMDRKSQEQAGAGLSEVERDILRNYYTSPAMVERAARLCLIRKLTKAEVLSNTSDTMRREVKDDSIQFFFAPSQVWTLTFDADGKALAADILGQNKHITRDEANGSPNPAPEDTARKLAAPQR